MPIQGSSYILGGTGCPRVWSSVKSKCQLVDLAREKFQGFLIELSSINHLLFESLERFYNYYLQTRKESCSIEDKRFEI
ncbi:hypothetical protein L1887_04554 [Cichorium endivia]|nr:hypothetical protein L1887_04554 [Cichorium endivia]